jgi:DNA polymerase III subunit alpha
MPNFIHLHNHTHYSLLDSSQSVDQLVNSAVADGQKAVALTDHGVMFGCYEFYKKCHKKDLNPILGFEAYVSTGSRFDRTARKKKVRNYTHLVLLAKDLQGYKNLMKLTSYAHTEGFYYRPRVDKELLEKYSEGIIASSACLGGVVNSHLIDGNFDKAVEEARYFKDLYGEDFYLELQDHGLDLDPMILREIPKIGKMLDIPLLATNDIHYEKKEHAVSHNVLLMIKDVSASNSGQVDINDLIYKVPEFYYKSAEQMHGLFRKFPDAIQNTLEVAEKCNVKFENKLYMPQFPIPDTSKASNLDEYLRELTYEGLDKKYDEITDEVRDRADYELGVIKNMGFPGYFLIVYDFIRAAVELGCSVGPGRGSAAGSIVAYALNITNVDPLPYDLLFERFLNPERVTMPDIDIDFNDEKRDVVIDYVKQKYGEDAVSLIITFGKLSTRAVITDVGRVLGVELSKIKEISSKIPVTFGKVLELAKAIELPELKWVKKDPDPAFQQMIKMSLELENKYRNNSTHAAGVVIAPGKISDYVPVYKKAKDKNQAVELVSQYQKDELEEAGLLKMDFLGLRTLSIIDKTLEMIKINYGKIIDVNDQSQVSFDDKETYDMIGEGHTLAIFQFESPGMQEYLRQLKPKDLEEIAAMNALYRPGPMENIPEYIDRKFGRKPIEYTHDKLISSLEKTYGIIVYQEQVMQLVRDVAGFSLGQADILRRAMGKKKVYIMEEMYPTFVEGAAKNEIDEKTAKIIWDLVLKFANYGFNKSHSVAYSIVAFQTAWLKAHYPAEFLAANMTAELNDQDKIVQLIEEAAKFDIKVLPPDVNRSFAGFRAVNNEIFFGMAGIRNVGINPVQSIIVAREEKAFESFFDFAARVDSKLVNRRALEALICAGACDNITGGKRAAMMAAVESALEYARAVHQNENVQMDSLFGGGEESKLTEPALPDVAEWSEKERLEKEKEVLNFYISGHPLQKYAPYLNSFSSFELDDLENPRIGESVRICGLITTIRTRLDKRNNTIAFVTIEDFKSRCECIFWSNTYAKFAHLIQPDTIIVAVGKSELNGENIKIVVDEIIPIEDTLTKYGKGFNIWIDYKTKMDKIEELSELRTGEDSDNPLMFILMDKGNGKKKILRSDKSDLPYNAETLNKLTKLFGLDNVRLLTE